MSKVEEIKKAASALSVNEREELLSWLQDVDDDLDRQMARDAAGGKLDFLIDEARIAVRDESLRDWPKPELRARFAPKQTKQMPGAVRDVEDSNDVVLEAVKNKIIVKSGYRKHP